MKKIIPMFVMAVFTLPFVAFANSSWVFVQKNAGPSSVDCPQTVEAVESGDVFVLGSPTNPNVVYMERLNRGTLCDRHQNGTVFGSLTCINNSKKTTSSQLVYESVSCGTDLPFVKSCRPREMSSKVVITETALVYSVVINWKNNPILECSYTAQ